MQSLWLIFQLLFCLFLGFILARRIPIVIERISFKILPYFTYVLLVAIAMEFADTLHSLANPEQILSIALLLSLSTSLGAFLCCYILFKLAGYQPMQGKISSALMFKSLLNISYAFIALLFGYALASLFRYFELDL